MKNWTIEKAYPYVLLVTGFLGLVASFILTYDKIMILKDPNFIPDCNINPIFSCGSVMSKPQAEVFGMPNALFGIIAFSVIVTIAVAMLFGAKFKPLFWKLLFAGTLAGLAGVIYLFFQGIYRINAICPYCAMTWVVVVALVVYTFVWNIKQKYMTVPKTFEQSAKFVVQNHIGVLVVIYLIILGLVLQHFWWYFGS